MRRSAKMMLRWGYVLLLYALGGGLVFYFMSQALAGPGHSPGGYSQLQWWLHCRNIFINVLLFSLMFNALWNALFSRRLLGGWEEGRGANGMHAVFMLVHLAASLLIIYGMLKATGRWAYVYAYYDISYPIYHFMPLLLAVPFFLATRMMAPAAVAHRFYVLKKLRDKVL